MGRFSGPQFHRLLRERGLKSTRQREQIVRVFMESGSHLSVEELYQRVRQKDRRIGYATVYRTLKLMAESGWASSRRFKDRLARFERQSAGEHHDHLICLLCGKIVEFASERIEELQSRIARRQGFRIFDHKLELYGHCPACIPKEKGEGNAKRGRSEHGKTV